MSSPSKIGKQFYLFRPKKSPSMNKNENNEKTNVKSEDLINLLMKKIESLNMNGGNTNIYEEKLKKEKLKAVDVDYKKEIYINKAEINKITSEEIKGKVNNKLEKLKKLRKRNGS